MMFLVWIKWVGGAQPTLCVVTKTREDAQEYIAKKMEGYRSSGLGVYAIEEVPLYEGEIQ